MVCSYPTPKDFTRLALVSKDYYLAVQQPLYEHIDIQAWEQLPRRVRTLDHRASRLAHQRQLKGSRQRQRWYKLGDAQLRERDIRKVNITLDTSRAKKAVSGVDFARCIGAISRRSNGVNTELALYGPWDTLLTQLSGSACTLPDIRRLVICLGNQGGSFQPSISPRNLDIWDTCFSGSSFPDLKEVEIDTLHGSPDQRSNALKEAAPTHRESHISRYQGGSSGLTPLYGLKRMTKISIKPNDLLTTPTLEHLFSSNIIPTKLTHLEIVNWPLLHQVRDYDDLSVLLQRGLPLLQHFKLHLQRNSQEAQHFYANYYHDLDEHPDWHLCNVVRELGQKIKSLDLALPLACNRVLLSKTKQPPGILAERHWPSIPREPYDTLRDRILSADYRYRRLICWDGVCRAGHEWQDMLELADNKGDMISWEIVSHRDKNASWHVSGCLSMSYKASDELKRELPQAER